VTGRVTLTELKQELARKGEIRLKVKVAPKSKRSELAGFMADGTLKVRVQAPPERGKANAELCALLAAELGIGRQQIQVVRGETSPSKHILIRGSRGDKL
jgi:uncharacterized protein (TIGR00251 family)